MAYTVEEIYSMRSYLGQMAGAPAAEEAVHRVQTRVAEVFQGVNPPLHVIEPETHKVSKGLRTFTLIPAWSHAAVLVGPEVPGQDSGDGAHLLVLWFSKDMVPVIPEVSLETWNAKARNWSF